MSCRRVSTFHFRFVGPEYWGEAHSGDWHMCSKGKQQSPINIEPDLLLYDGNLGRLVVNSPPVSLLIDLNCCFFYLFEYIPSVLIQRYYQFIDLFKSGFQFNKSSC